MSNRISSKENILSVIKKAAFEDFRKLEPLVEERIRYLVKNVIAPEFNYLRFCISFKERDGALSKDIGEALLNDKNTFSILSSTDTLIEDEAIIYYMNKNSDLDAFLEDLVYYKIEDLFRAFPLSFLEKSDSEVRKEIIKIRSEAEKEFLSSKSLEDFIADLKLNNDSKAKISAKLTTREREILEF